MARGWESKSVESQIESAGSLRENTTVPQSAEQREKQAKRDSLLLTRRRVLHDLETAQNARYRATLEQALAHLDGKLAELE
jgi:hypothetical protein